MISWKKQAFQERRRSQNVECYWYFGKELRHVHWTEQNRHHWWSSSKQSDFIHFLHMRWPFRASQLPCITRSCLSHPLPRLTFLYVYPSTSLLLSTVFPPPWRWSQLPSFRSNRHMGINSPSHAPAHPRSSVYPHEPLYVYAVIPFLSGMFLQQWLPFLQACSSRLLFTSLLTITLKLLHPQIPLLDFQDATLAFLPLTDNIPRDVIYNIYTYIP